MIRRPPRSTLSSSSAASDVYKRQFFLLFLFFSVLFDFTFLMPDGFRNRFMFSPNPRNGYIHGRLCGCLLLPFYRTQPFHNLSLIHISEPTRLGMISYAV